MADPQVLAISYEPLYRQVIDKILQDTDPTRGILSALGNGKLSVYPNFESPEPTADRTICPTPFIIVYPGGKDSLDRAGREMKIIIEIHDDEEMGFQRWPGILERLYDWLIVGEWRPKSDTVKYKSGLYFKTESADLNDPRYTTLVTQAILGCLVTDRTSGHGYAG